MIGTTLSHHRIVEKLGEGGMGSVYKARDSRLDRFVALKILPHDKLANAERKRRFVQEARAASSLNHPNIFTIYDIDSAGDPDFIAMECVTGKTLEQLIGRKGLPSGEALRYAVQIADAHSKAHAAGIVHRDLRPSNIMVTEDGIVNVLDFGLAKLTEPVSTNDETATVITDEGSIVGTVAYMSPEQAEGKPVDPRSDIFSFGSVLYEMLTGRRAFQGETKVSTLAAILHHEPKSVSETGRVFPPELERAVQRCLRKEPARRRQNMSDLKVFLQELKEESDSRRSAPTVAAPPPRRSLRWLLIGAAAVVLVCAGVSVYLWLRNRPAVSRHDKKDKLPFASLASQAASLQPFNPSADNGYSVNFDTSASTPAAFCSQTASPDVTLLAHLHLIAARSGAGVAARSGERLTSRVSTAASVSETSSASNSRRPLSISCSTTPNAQMSARRSRSLPLACSGAM